MLRQIIQEKKGGTFIYYSWGFCQQIYTMHHLILLLYSPGRMRRKKSFSSSKYQHEKLGNQPCILLQYEKKSILHLKNSGIMTQEQQKSHCSQLRPRAFLLPFWRSNLFSLFLLLWQSWHVSLNPKFLWLVLNWDKILCEIKWFGSIRLEIQF